MAWLNGARMTDQIPLVVVGLPVFNGADVLRRAIESLLNQTYKNIVLLISDNGSTDDTSLICTEFAAQDARVKYLRYEENRGAGWNFQNVLDLGCFGDYFMFAAHDDFWEPAYIEVCVNFLKTHPKTLCCSTRTVHFNDQKEEDGSISMVLKDVETPISTVGLDILGRFIKYLSLVRENSIFYGLFRSNYMKGKSISNQLGGDWYFMIELGFIGEIHTLESILLKRRMGGTSATIPRILHAVEATDEFLLNASWLSVFNHIFEMLEHEKNLTKWQVAKARIFTSSKYLEGDFVRYDVSTANERKTYTKKLIGARSMNSRRLLIMPDWDCPDYGWNSALIIGLRELQSKEDSVLYLYLDPNSSKQIEDVEFALTSALFEQGEEVDTQRIQLVDFLPLDYLDVLFCNIEAFISCPGKHSIIGLSYAKRFKVPVR